MDDAAYKRLFSRPGMVRDLLRGFAARDWSGALDFASLTPLPASYVSRDLRQRHGDLVWRVRFGGERWLYLVLLLEFQSGVDRAMAVRMLTCSGLLYQKLVAEGGQVVEHQRVLLEVPLGESLLDGGLPLDQPVHRLIRGAAPAASATRRRRTATRYTVLGRTAALADGHADRARVHPHTGARARRGRAATGAKPGRSDVRFTHHRPSVDRGRH